VDNVWHDANNWASVSGGVGGAGIPTASDDVYFDANGNAMCQPTAAIECNNFTMEATASTKFVLPSDDATINGDFTQHEGYFGPTGGPDHWIEFKGNWLFDGGTFSVGTGSGVDPTCEFSGTSKTYVNDATGAASFQNVLVSGTYRFSGTRLSQMEISQELSVTGTMTIGPASGVSTNWVTLGTGGSLGTLSGGINGTRGILYWRWNKTRQVLEDMTPITCKQLWLEIDDPGEDDVDVDLAVDSWTLVNADWTHVGTEPWIDTDDGDTSYIELPADTPSQNEYDEYYGVENVDSKYLTLATTNVKVHLKGRLVAGSGGTATLIAVKPWVWDGGAWVDGGLCLFNSETYTDNAGSDISASIDNLTKVNGMRLKLELLLVIGGGADKGEFRITEAHVEVEGDATYNPRVFLNPAQYSSQTEVVVEFTEDQQTFELLGGGRHYFMGKLTIEGDDADITNDATFDCATNDAEMWVGNIFKVATDAFPSATFHMLWGNGTHVFRSSVQFYFSYAAGASAVYDCQAAHGTIILWPKGRQLQLLGGKGGGL